MRICKRIFENRIRSEIARRYIISHGLTLQEKSTLEFIGIVKQLQVYKALNISVPHMVFLSYMSLTLDNNLQISAKNRILI